MKKSIVTIGVFDGVHIGHRAVIKKVVSRAKATDSESIVVTFDPHPLKILGGKHLAPSLISLKHRVSLIKDLGVDKVVVMKFDKKLSCMDAGNFIRNIIATKLDAKEMFVGEDFCFGKGAKADISTLINIGKTVGIKVHPVNAIKKNHQIISSSLIRKLIMNGQIVKASKLLGRPFSILGTVVRGAKLATALGYPTANINPHHEAMPPSGVYAVKIKFCNKIYKGVMNIGVRPTFYDHGRDVEPSIEVHMFGFRGTIYGKDLEVIFAKRLRAEKKFKTIDSLIRQVGRDVRHAQKTLQ